MNLFFFQFPHATARYTYVKLKESEIQDEQVETKNEPVNSDNDAKIDTDGSKVSNSSEF